MLRSIKSMDGHKILAEDGEIGRISDFYFDDESWVVRYLVVNTGNWLVDKKVLISPASFVDTDWHRREISVALTKEQIEKSPDVSHDKPVSRQKEAELAKYYTWPTYWPIGGTAAPMHEAAIAHTLKSEAEEIGRASCRERVYCEV